MYCKKECIAMLLAGGQGSRLYDLTKQTAKPAVTFGGKYKIIDFPLSNCINSGIDTVGVLTQYQPLALNEYIGNGQPWDLDRMSGGVMVLPPYQGKNGADWYKGTANAIYQNLNFIKRYDPDYVLILSGDEIITINYEDGTFEEIDSCDVRRLITFYDGQYTVPKHLLQQWIALEELSSYDRQYKFYELLDEENEDE